MGNGYGTYRTFWPIDFRPLIQLFSLYEKREGGWMGPGVSMPYPHTFSIDDVGGYKKPPDWYPVLAPEPNLPGTRSYMNVTDNDGVVTQEIVKWDPIQQKARND